uniref:GTPase IMAP family member 8-like n=1 Tax=Poecilia formosa TaxID=48698 RepID=A0A096MCT5_POEFO
LVGQKCSGKSTTGNMILVKDQFNFQNYQDHIETSTCVKHEGRFDGVKVSVVETPGWFSDPTPPDWIKDEVLHSVSMCSPGPHVFLLVVPILRSFTEKDLKALVEIMKPLTERVWRHCMVVFTRGDWINDVPVENYIVREGKELQELLEKCGNRYHVLKNFNSDVPVQVKELFQKIINIFKHNKECFNEGILLLNNTSISVSVSGDNTLTNQRTSDDSTDKGNTKVNLQKIRKPNLKSLSVVDNSSKVTSVNCFICFLLLIDCTILKVVTSLNCSVQISNRYVMLQYLFRQFLQITQSHPATELRIVLIGGRYNNLRSGKSLAGNFILGQNVFNTSRRTAQSEAKQQEVFGRRVTVVDTPELSEETSEMDKLEIENSVNLCPPGPHAVLLVIPVMINTDESYLRSVQEHMSLFKEEIWKHTHVLFTCGDWLGVKTVEEHIESDEGLQWIVNKCENRYHVLNNKDHSDKTQVKELLEKIEEMWAGNEKPYYEVELDRAAELETKRETGDKMARRLKTINE